MKKIRLFILVPILLIGCSQTLESTVQSNHLILESKAVEPILEEMVIKLDTFKYKLPWIETFAAENMIVNRIVTPAGYERIDYEVGTFEHWLRHLPLKTGTPKVYLYNGELKSNQSAHAYVMDIDIGTKDLQQCADATMRLRAEYLFATDQKDKIAFNYTNGAYVPYSKWRSGYTPVPKSGGVDWVASTKAGEGYEKFKSYLIQVFNYAGTLSLSKELNSKALKDIKPGDLFIKGGSPGHAVMVMDMAINPTTGEKVFIISQSYMPAQNIQILRNNNNYAMSPWYSLSAIKDVVQTPEWTFYSNQVMCWD